MVQSSLFETFLSEFSHPPPRGDLAHKLNALAHPSMVERGQVAPLESDGDVLVYIADGATKLIASASGGREQIVAFHFSGDLVSVPANAWHSYSLCALSKAEMLVFPADEFLEMARDDAALHDELLRRSLTALHRCRDKAVGLGRKSAQERVASFLVGMAERIGKADMSACILVLPMSRRDIGDSLGLTIETISRQLSSLRESGLIETEGRSRIVLRDIVKLAARAGHTGHSHKISR